MGSVQLVSKAAGCQRVWFKFELNVVNGWPIDLVRIFDGRFLYNPLGINAERMPMDNVVRGQSFEGSDGLHAWRLEAPFDMEW
jgi:hypothetical protein